MLAILTDPIYKEHHIPGHPECEERLDAIDAALAASERLAALPRLDPQEVSDEALLRIHQAHYLERVRAQLEGGADHLDPDTQVCKDSYRVARHAVGGCLAGLDRIATGEVQRAFFAVRPPGHHAEADRSMGFCLLNNVAVAARHLQAKHDVGRVAIFDFDAHHGNGTMHSFWDDPLVGYASVHEWPHFPGTGNAEEVGVGRGRGTTLSMPLPRGAGDAEYMTATERFADAMERFRPHAILISAGFDAHQADPLANHEVTEAGYARLAALLRELAAYHCEDRIAAFLEGGYDLDTLGRCVVALLEQWID